MAVGQSLGGPWTYIAPAAGFGIGLVADMKFMKGMHGGGGKHDMAGHANKDATPVRGVEVEENKVQQQALHLGKG
ncbi:MAG: hypothetical protein IH604_00735 [Burkholderiales bacterium]|nr:hypothetical protein [Burkholderiales bacterium]